MWTYASLEAEPEGLIEHTLCPFPLPPPLLKQSIFQCCSLLRRREKGGRNVQKIPQGCCIICGQRWTMCPLELGIETNIVCSYD